MSPQATQAGGRTFGSTSERYQARGVRSSCAIPPPRRRKSGYSQFFFIALFIGLASSIGFVGVLASLLLGG
jgi:hypothetical protein